MRIIFVRHGQTEDNVRNAISTSVPGPPITKAGEAAVASAAVRILSFGAEAMFHSGALRAKQTADLLAAGSSIRPAAVAGLQEIDAGDLEGHTDEASHLAYG